MKIRDIHVDGFGIFHNYQLKNLSPGMTILLGPNEAGKSTLLAFIVRLLFGFPDKRGRQNLYLPLSGGTHGGSLVVLLDNGERYIIERYAKRKNSPRIYLPDGTAGGEAELSYLLGHANKDIFENIYAFSLSELHDFGTLNKDAVRERLYSAGRGTGSVSFGKIQNFLNSEADKLFKENGSNPQINGLFREIKDIDRRLRELENDLENFEKLHAQKEALSKEIKSVSKERDIKRIELNHTQNLVKVWDDWRVIQEKKRLLRDIPSVGQFPEEGIQRLERFIEKIDDVQERIIQIQTEKEAVKIRQSAITVDELLIENSQAILELQREGGRYLSAREDLPKTENRLNAYRENFNKALLEIGQGWTEEKLSQFDTSIPAKEKVRNRHSRIQEARVQIKDVEKELESMDTREKELAADIETIDERLKKYNGSYSDEGQLEKQKKKLQSLRSQHLQLKAFQKELHEIEESTGILKKEIEIAGDKEPENLPSRQLDGNQVAYQRQCLQNMLKNFPKLKEIENNLHNIQEKEELITLLTPQKDNSASVMPLWPAIIIVGAGILSLILMIVLHNIWTGAYLLIISITVSLIYLLIRSRLLSQKEYLEEREEVEKKIDLSANKQRIKDELSSIKEDMLSLSRACGFETIPEPRLIEEKYLERERITKVLQEIEKAEENRESIRKKLFKIKEGMLLDARECGFQDIPSIDAIEERDSVLEKLNRSIFEKGILEEKRQDAEKIFASVRRNKIRLQKELKILQERRSGLKKDWQNWLISKGVDPDLSTEGVLEVFSAMGACIEKKKAIEEYKSRIDSMSSSIVEYEEKFDSLIKNCKRKKEGLNPFVELEKIIRELNLSIENHQKLKQLKGEEERLGLEEATLASRMAELKKQLSELLLEGSARSETEFRKNADNFAKRRRYQDEIIQRETIIRKISGDGKLYDNFLIELGQANLEILNEQKLKRMEQFEDTEEEYSALMERSGSINKEIEQIERREEGSALRMERMLKIEALREKADEWAVLTLSRNIMKRAVEKYERERQPSIIKDAQSFFSRITMGNYPRIYAPLGENAIYSEDKSGRRKEIQELSRGTAEQLYLSLRFGFIKEFSKRSESLPIIFDDIMVNFDGERIRTTCEIVKELAEKYQILYFTCHPGIADLLITEIPSANRVDLTG